MVFFSVCVFGLYKSLSDTSKITGEEKGFFSCDFSRFHPPIWLVVMTIKSILICFGHDSVSVSAALYREVGVIEFSPKLAGSDGSFFS